MTKKMTLKVGIFLEIYRRVKKSEEFRIPDFMKLVFRWDEEDLERTISLPIKHHAPSGIESEI